MSNEPTSEEIANHAEVEVDGRKGYAAWYPQMGGYVGKCVVVRDGTCVDVYVWHDGDFPFSEDHYGISESPRILHHCDGDQFVAFGHLISRIAEGEVPTR